MRTNFRFLLALGLLGCQPDKPAHRPPARPPAPALRDSLPETPPTGQATSRSWHRLTQRTRLNAPLVYRTGTARPQAFDTAAPPPPEARLHDLTLKASEYFQIDPTQPAEVHGREGTIVRLPAHILVDAQQVPARGPVWVELKECYSVADLLLSNIPTVGADGGLLDSGGSVLVRASTQGRPLQVAAGQAYQLELPYTRARKGMALFYGNGRRTQPPTRWMLAEKILRPAPARIVTQATQMPSYGTGPADLNRLVHYPPAALANHTEGLVYASFVVDESGQVLNPVIIRGLGDGCDEEVLRVLRQTSGHWVPAQQGGRLVKVKMTLPLRFSAQAGPLAAETPPDELAADTLPMTDDDQPDLAAELTPAARHYAFQAGQLGWLSGARPWSPATDVVPLAVAADADPLTDVYLVFRSGTTVAAGVAQGSGYAFAAVPANQRAMVVGVRYRNGIPYLALRETTTGAAEPVALEFRETTLAELERALEKLQ